MSISATAQVPASFRLPKIRASTRVCFQTLLRSRAKLKLNGVLLATTLFSLPDRRTVCPHWVVRPLRSHIAERSKFYEQGTCGMPLPILMNKDASWDDLYQYVQVKVSLAGVVYEPYIGTESNKGALRQ